MNTPAHNPPLPPMTVREAVEIYRILRELYAAQREFELTRGISEPVYAEELARWDRARAIVDAMVEAHEARCKHADNECLSDDFILGQDVERKFKEVRALTRGEEGNQ